MTRTLSRSISISRSQLFPCIATYALALATACSSDPAAGSTEATAGPLYVTATRVFSADDSIGYLTTFPSLAAGTHVDLSRAIEIDDAWVFGEADPYFYTATIFDPVIQRWELSSNGALVAGPKLSFANQGVAGTYTAAAVPLFSKTKSYFVDSESQQVVIWNPSDMSFIGTIPLNLERMADYTPEIAIALTPERLFVTVLWSSLASGWTKYGSSTKIIAIDPKTDRVLATTDEPRCESLSPAGVASDESAYFAPWDYHSTVRSVFGDGFGARSCALRVVPPATSYDAGYDVDLSALVGGRPAGSMRMIGNGQALLHVWHEELAEATPENWSETRFLPAYLWYRWQLGEPSAEPLPAQAPTSEGGEWINLDDKTYTLSANSEYSETTVVELSDTGELRPGATIDGWTTNIIRVR